VSTTAPQYVSVATIVTALRFMHGVDCYGLTETTETEADGVQMYCLTVPHPDGDLEAHEGDWVMQDTVTGLYHVCHDQTFRAMFTQEGVIPT
jgi:hypothetical protein